MQDNWTDEERAVIRKWLDANVIPMIPEDKDVIAHSWLLVRIAETEDQIGSSVVTLHSDEDQAIYSAAADVVVEARDVGKASEHLNQMSLASVAASCLGKNMSDDELVNDACDNAMRLKAMAKLASVIGEDGLAALAD